MAWYHKCYNKQCNISQNVFTMQAKKWVNGHQNKWQYKGKKKVTVKHLMNNTEPLIIEYNLKNWMNPDYNGSDIHKICKFAKRYDYRGMERIIDYSCPPKENTSPL